MASLLELGVISWINQNSEIANKLQLHPFDIENAALLQNFLAQAQVTHEVLEDIGRDARDIGTAKYRAERVYEIRQGTYIYIMHRLRRHWRAIDGTVMQGQKDNERRCQFGPIWSQNSCAVDVTLFAAILLDAGRIQIDQICHTSKLQLNTAAALTRYIVSKPWGLFSSSQRSALRDVLASELSAIDSKRFPRYQYMDVNDVFRVTLARLPQLSHTWCVTQTCCDLVPRIPPNPEIERATGLSISLASPEATVQSALSEVFGSYSEHEVLEHCSSNGKCTRKVQFQRNILDHMPPLLLVYIGGRGVGRRSWKETMLNELNITYHSTEELKKVHYRLLGCIVFINNNHYILRWRDRLGSWLSYDGSKGEKIEPVSSLHHGLQDMHAIICTAFYEQIGV